ncbi:ABC transporter ATP-binding protein [Salinicoccus sp. YB14-2]|uniref:ABC transporter ATP-binding protein n=1 Tax=Salinicoccus sp. YB14-2 TaxID=1572701 RepID=UPI00068B0FB0|nr:ABC transporter ATP-binding protein [Salinicoccus sp. YB14-2]
MLTINNLSKIYRGSDKGVKHFNLNLNAGDICAFIGANGAGKTTTIKSIVGLHEYDEGEVILSEINLKNNPEKFKSMLGYSPDSPTLYNNMTGKAYIELIASLYNMSQSELESELTVLLKALKFENAIYELISSYSHGMKQRLILIGLLMHNPKLIILDEPFVGLDPNATGFLVEEMKRRAAMGSIIIYSTHVLEVAEKICNRIVIIDDSEVVMNDYMENILSKNVSLTKVFADVTSNE